MSLSPDQPGAADRGYALPRSFAEALWRGARAQCPRCGKGKLFRKWLKPVDACACCGLDMSGQRSDDLPAYVAILVTGHLLAPVIIALVADVGLSPGALLAILLPLAVAMLVAMLQPSKGAVIAIQWWNGMHGFRKERAESDPQ